MTALKKFRWFWPWDDGKEEAWLREMAQKGWHFKSVSGSGIYTFEPGQARDDYYRLDFFIDSKAVADYLQLFLDAGWEHLGGMNGRRYFRKTATSDAPPEIFTDNESKAKKYGRILVFLVVFAPVYFTAVNLVSRRGGAVFEILSFAMFLFMILYGYVIVWLLGRMMRDKRRL